MTAMAVYSSIGQLWIAVLNGIWLYRTCALTAPDSSDPGEYPEGWCIEYLNVIRMPNVDRKYRKCESKYERVII